MIFTGTQENLHRASSLVSRIASKSANLPILANVLLETKENALLISATNLEIGMQVLVHGRVEGEGKAVVPARLLDDCIALLPKGNVSLTKHEESIVVAGGSNKNKIHLMPHEEFPLFPTVDVKKQITLSARDLGEVIRATGFAASYDESRPELSGMLMSVRNSILTAVCTDSYRLAERALPIAHNVDFEEIIIPLRTIQEIGRIVSMRGEQNEEGASEVAVGIGEHQLSLQSGEVTLVSRVIDGEYPPYRDIIPNDFTVRAQVSHDELEQSLRAAGLFSKSGINDITIQFTPHKGITLQAANMQVGESTSFVAAEVEGKEATLVLNWKYVMEGVQSMESAEVILEASNNTSPVVLKPHGVSGHLYLIMPIRQ